MSLAIAIRDSVFNGFYDYEPVSQLSGEVTRRWAEERNYLQGSASDWFPTVEAACQVIRSECNTADWDGQGAFAVNDQVIAITENIVRALFALVPKGMPAPEIIPEADGEICINWTADPEKLLSLSVGAQGKINFAGQFGTEGGIHGWQPIDATSPNTLDESLQDVAKYLGKLYAPTISRRSA